MKRDSLIKGEAVEKVFFVRFCKGIRVFIGIFSDVNQPILRWIGIAAHIFLQICAIIVTVVMILGANTLYGFFARVGDFCSFLTVLGLRSVYFVRERRILLLCYQLGEKWAEYHKSIRHPAGIKIIRHCEIKMRVISFFLTFGSFFVFIAYSAYPIIHYYFIAHERHNHVAFPLKIYYPFESSPSVRAFVYVIICACIAYYSLLLAIISSVFLCLFCTLEAAFKLNSMFYQRFHSDTSDKSSTARKLEIARRWGVAKHIITINEHQKLYRMAADCQALMREILLMMYSGATVAASFNSVLISVDPKRYGASATIVCLPLLHMLFVFFMASRVTLACEETANILYWQHMELLRKGSKIDAKVFLFLLMRAQKPVIFEAGRLRKLTLENYVAFMQNIYSFTMLLHSVSRKD